VAWPVPELAAGLAAGRLSPDRDGLREAEPAVALAADFDAAAAEVAAVPARL
jgi:hypothetical protein